MSTYLSFIQWWVYVYVCCLGVQNCCVGVLINRFTYSFFFNIKCMISLVCFIIFVGLLMDGWMRWGQLRDTNRLDDLENCRTAHNEQKKCQQPWSNWVLIFFVFLWDLMKKYKLLVSFVNWFVEIWYEYITNKIVKIMLNLYKVEIRGKYLRWNCFDYFVSVSYEWKQLKCQIGHSFFFKYFRYGETYISIGIENNAVTTPNTHRCFEHSGICVISLNSWNDKQQIRVL